MRMKFTIEVTPEDNPNTYGECLRSRFFDETPEPIEVCKEYHKVGCYSSFTWQKDVIPLPQVPVEDEHNHLEGVEPEELCWACSNYYGFWTRGKLDLPEGSVECRYYWDGDGTLEFIFEDGSRLINNDCKKDHEWHFYASGEGPPSWD